MKRVALLCICLMAASAVSISAQLRAVVQEVSGKVEVKAPNADWTPAAVDMVLSDGTVVSTGFGSRAVLQIGLTRVTVSPLTRLQVEQILKRESTNSANLTLRVGKVNAQVKSAGGERSEFTLKGPRSTAAVRGCQFDFDGYTLEVTEGVVEFINLLLQRRNVEQGETSDTDGVSFPSSGESGNENDSLITPPSGSGLLGGQGGVTPVTGTFSVTVN